MADTTISLPIEELEEDSELPSKTYNIDFDKGRILGTVDEQEALKQAIIKTLLTPRFKCLIYSDQYGCEIEENLRMHGDDEGYIESVIEGFVKDALSPDTRITDIYDFAYESEDDAYFINFKVDSIFGEIEIDEEI